MENDENSKIELRKKSHHKPKSYSPIQEGFSPFKTRLDKLKAWTEIFNERLRDIAFTPILDEPEVFHGMNQSEQSINFMRYLVERQMFEHDLLGIERFAHIDEEIEKNLFYDEHLKLLNDAARSNNHKKFESLHKALRHSRPEDINNGDIIKCIYTSVKYSSLEIVESLFPYYKHQPIDFFDPSTPDEGYSLLHLCVSRGDAKLVQTLLSTVKIDVDFVGKNGNTALVDSVTFTGSEKPSEFFEIAKIILKHKAEPDIPSADGNTALIIATENFHSELIECLVDAGADIMAKNRENDSPLSIVVSNFHRSESSAIIKSMILNHSNNIMRRISNVKSHKNLGITKHRVDVHIVTALGMILLESPVKRRILTEDELLWKVDSSFMKRSMKEISAIRDMENEGNLMPENMLTWAIHNSNVAVKILLESNLPLEWKCNLCVAKTVIGTPIACAVKENNLEALIDIFNVLKNAWANRYLTKQKQIEGDHPLDAMEANDILLIAKHYPLLMADFLENVQLSPAYPWVTKIHRAHMNPNFLWVCLSKQRSPESIWETNYEEFPKHKSFLVQLILYFRRKNNQLAYIVKYPFKRFGTTFRTTDRACYMNFLPFEKWQKELDVEAFMIPIQKLGTFEMLQRFVTIYSKASNPTMFSSPIIGAIVELHWRLYGFHIHIANIILYIFFLLNFIVVVYFHTTLLAKDYGKIFLVILQCTQILSCSYYIYLEFTQMKQLGSAKKYLRGQWNKLELPTYLILMAGIIAQFFEREHGTVAVIYGISSLLIWFKVLYLMRPFITYGPMVFVIFQVIADIRVFIEILIIVIIGFGNAYFIIIRENQFYNPDSFVSFLKYLRLMVSYSLGNDDFDSLDEGRYSFVLSLIWVLFCLIVSIILLNLLIAIISESYESVSAGRKTIWRLEQARILTDIHASLSKKEKEKVRKTIESYPWLQVLAPKHSKIVRNTENDFGKDAVKSIKEIVNKLGRKLEKD